MCDVSESSTLHCLVLPLKEVVDKLPLLMRATKGPPRCNSHHTRPEYHQARVLYRMLMYKWTFPCETRRCSLTGSQRLPCPRLPRLPSHKHQKRSLCFSMRLRRRRINACRSTFELRLFALVTEFGLSCRQERPSLEL